MKRTADFGCAAAVTPDGLLPVSLHRLLVDGFGRFRGIEVIAGGTGLDGPWLDGAERVQLERILEGTGHALKRKGYCGPFGIDAWRYQEPGRDAAFHPLGEINGRLTFGWAARALVDRVCEPLGIDAHSRVRLIFGQRDEPQRDVQIVPLLHALEAGDQEIRLEIRDPA